MDKVTSETPDQRLRRAQARSEAATKAHRAARAAGGLIDPALSREAAEARTALHREEMGPERFDAAQSWGAHHILDRAKRLVSFGEEDKSGHQPMMVVSHEQFAEMQATGTIKDPKPVPAPKWEG